MARMPSRDSWMFTTSVNTTNPGHVAAYIPVTDNNVVTGVAISGTIAGKADRALRSDHEYLPQISSTRCSVHDLYYSAQSSHPVCPACDLETVVNQLRRQIHELANANTRLRGERDLYESRVDGLEAMREAMALIEEPAEIVMLSRLVSFYRESPGEYTLLVERKSRGPVLATLQRRKKGPDWVVLQHRFATVGGVALWSAYNRLLKITSPQQAVHLLCTVISESLPEDDDDGQDAA